jgi:hypothetical protein
MSQNSRNQGFSNYICLMIERSGSGSRVGSGSGSIPLTNGSGSGRPKNTWIRIRKPWKNFVFACRSYAHNCRAADLGGEGRADGGGAARNVLIAAGLRHHGEGVVPNRSPILLNLCTVSTSAAKETVSRDFLIPMFLHFFLEILHKFAEIFSVSKTPAAMS